MSDLEIDRRCSSCGASVRRRAMFCPQCGKAVARHDELAETVDLKLPTTSRASETADTIAIDKSELDTMTTQSPVIESAATSRNTVDQPVARKQPNRSDNEAHGRVDRLRKASTVVIEQAHYDPSLRFLLVTAGLFILFILLLVLSKLLG